MAVEPPDARRVSSCLISVRGVSSSHGHGKVFGDKEILVEEEEEEEEEFRGGKVSS
jgi:hypothetical protein